jgi:LuxR family maltose regulon positive regulatory protein
VLQAVLHSHHSRVNQARKLVEPLLSGDLPAVAAPTVVDAWLLEAVLVERTGDQRRAHEAVTRALAAAEPVGTIRPFVHAGKPVRELLARGAGRFGRLDRFATTTMTALPPAATTSAGVLTSRERDLLVELPSMRTTEEIANSLFVSVNTVKTHLRGIYRKLGVNQRRDAVLVARRLGLI